MVGLLRDTARPPPRDLQANTRSPTLAMWYALSPPSHKTCENRYVHALKVAPL